MYPLFLSPVTPLSHAPPQAFPETAAVLRNHGLLDGESIAEFVRLGEKAQAAAEAAQDLELEDVPAEFLDPVQVRTAVCQMHTKQKETPLFFVYWMGQGHILLISLCLTLFTLP